jgi:hypothetical protein
MFAANSHVIRFATTADAIHLRRLATHDRQRNLARPALVGEIDGRVAAAVSLVDLRVVSDGSAGTERLKSLLLMRARATRAHRATPSVRERIVAMLPWGRRPADDDMQQAA